MGKKVDKLQRLVDKMATRYGPQDEDVLQLRAALESLQRLPKAPTERRQFGQGAVNFLTPAKQMYLTLKAESIRH